MSDHPIDVRYERCPHGLWVEACEQCLRDEIERLRRELAGAEAEHERDVDHYRNELTIARHRLAQADEKLAEARATNHLDIVLPPFGHAFTIPHDRLDMEALKWLRLHCVIVTEDEWLKVNEKLAEARELLREVNHDGQDIGGNIELLDRVEAFLAATAPADSAPGPAPTAP